LKQAKIFIALCLVLIFVLITLHAFAQARDSEVVIYTALDQIYSEPILKGFERETGIKVKAVYDTEAAKTTGLVSRLMAERKRPRCDVFWNNEIIRTIRLKEEGLLERYQPQTAQSIPETFKDREGYWTGFAARARVLAFNTGLIKREEVPRTMAQLTDRRWRGKIGMAYPLFGTTATHAAVLFALWGNENGQKYLNTLKENDITILDGNMGVCRAVAFGELSLGLTDTDDANLLRGQRRPIDWILIDHDGEGSLLVPNTLALMKGAPHSETGKRLIDYLLRPGVEKILAASPSAQIPLHPGVEAPPEVQRMAKEKFLRVDFAEAARQLAPSAEFCKAIFAKP